MKKTVTLLFLLSIIVVGSPAFTADDTIAPPVIAADCDEKLDELLYMKNMFLYCEANASRAIEMLKIEKLGDEIFEKYFGNQLTWQQRETLQADQKARRTKIRLITIELEIMRSDLIAQVKKVVASCPDQLSVAP